MTCCVGGNVAFVSNDTLSCEPSSSGLKLATIRVTIPFITSLPANVHRYTDEYIDHADSAVNDEGKPGKPNAGESMVASSSYISEGLVLGHCLLSNSSDNKLHANKSLKKWNLAVTNVSLKLVTISSATKRYVDLDSIISNEPAGCGKSQPTKSVGEAPTRDLREPTKSVGEVLTRELREQTKSVGEVPAREIREPTKAVGEVPTRDLREQLQEQAISSVIEVTSELRDKLSNPPRESEADDPSRGQKQAMTEESTSKPREEAMELHGQYGEPRVQDVEFREQDKELREQDGAEAERLTSEGSTEPDIEDMPSLKYKTNDAEAPCRGRKSQELKQKIFEDPPYLKKEIYDESLEISEMQSQQSSVTVTLKRKRGRPPKAARVAAPLRKAVRPHKVARADHLVILEDIDKPAQQPLELRRSERPHKRKSVPEAEVGSIPRTERQFRKKHCTINSHSTYEVNYANTTLRLFGNCRQQYSADIVPDEFEEQQAQPPQEAYEEYYQEAYRIYTMHEVFHAAHRDDRIYVDSSTLPEHIRVGDWLLVDKVPYNVQEENRDTNVHLIVKSDATPNDSTLDASAVIYNYLRGGESPIIDPVTVDEQLCYDNNPIVTEIDPWLSPLEFVDEEVVEVVEQVTDVVQPPEIEPMTSSMAVIESQMTTDNSDTIIETSELDSIHALRNTADALAIVQEWASASFVEVLEDVREARMQLFYVLHDRFLRLFR